MTESTAAPSAPQEAFALTTSRGFPDWLARTGASLAFTTYQAGKLFFIGMGETGRIAVFERTFARCMGLAASADARKLALATHYQIYRFDNVLPPGEASGGHDAIYTPRTAWITGDVDAHDVAFDADGNIVFVNTLFSCLATISEGFSFKPIWRPPFITKLAPEDRCHMNGLAMENGRPRYVTMVSASDVADGWRDRRTDGGMIMDVTTNERVVEGLSMPHSPRVHDGRLWVLNSGAGELGFVDDSGKFQAVAFCPGYARGLSFVGRYALVGLSQARENRTFQGLPLDEALSSRDAVARCGILVIDTVSGDTVEWVRIEGVVRELFDVVALPGVRNPSAIGLIGDDIRRVISINED
ncbi:MAG: TIGR03032 family protein [Caulobacter sp.]|nr:TIGR03032 family protein [Caulobacter sp.]